MYKKAGLVVMGCILCFRMGMAQTTGTISGIVHDSTGAVVPGASIAVTNVETGITRGLITDAQGRYKAPNLSVGRYEAQASLSGFQTAIRSGIDLTVGQEAVVNLTLQVGQVAQTVEVTGEASVVEATNATITGLVDEKAIRDLPLNGRSFADLVTLQVGTVVPRSSSIQNPSALGGGVRISISGSRPLTNSFLLDGTDINDPRNAVPGGATGLTLGVDTVREFRVLTNSYSAEYGRSSGGVLTAVTRSGTNALHGTAFDFLRNAKLDAAKWEDNKFGREKPPFKRNQFGFTLGGPIRKNKTFFFGSYEGLRDRLGGTRVSFVPNALAHQGIMPNAGAIGAPLVNVGVAPGVKPWLDLYPLPNRRDLGNGTGELAFATSQPANENYFTTRIDHSFSSKHSIFGRYTFDDSIVDIPQALPIGRSPSTARNQYLTVQADSVFSATTLNTFRFGMNKSSPFEVYNTDLPAGLGSFVPGVPFNNNGGQLNVTGIASIGNYLDPRGQKYTLLEWSDDVTLVRGRHTLKTGFIFKKTLDYQAAVTAGGGQYTINGGLFDMLQGKSNAFNFQWPSTTSNRDWRQNLFGAYLQDDLKWKSNLTLNLGLREEFMTSPNELNGQCANVPDVMLTAPKVGCPLFETLKNNWAPRVGVAWDTRNNSKLVLRGGWGLFYDQPFPTYWQVPGRGNPPFVINVNRPNAPFPDALAREDFTKLPNYLAGGSAAVGLRTLHYTGTPYGMQYNFNIQSELRPGTGVTLGYLGSQGRKLITTGTKNVNHWVILPDGRKCYPSTDPLRPFPDCPGLNPGRLNPVWSSFTQASTEGNTSYNGFVASLNQRFRSGLRLQVSYTFSKTISMSDTVFGSDFGGSTVDAPAGLTDAYNAAMDRGVAGYNLKHSFVLNYSYDLPFHGTGWKGKLIQGWQLSGITSRQSGIPFGASTTFLPGILVPSSLSGDGFVSGGIGGSLIYKPDLAPGKSNNPINGVTAGCTGFSAGRPLGTPDLYFDPCVFSYPAQGFYGNLGRHTLTGPGFINFNFALLKNTAITEKIHLQFRAEFFNLLNHPNFDNPAQGTGTSGFTNGGLIFDSRGNRVPTAGLITTSVTNARQIQFALKLVF